MSRITDSAVVFFFLQSSFVSDNVCATGKRRGVLTVFSLCVSVYFMLKSAEPIVPEGELVKG